MTDHLTASHPVRGSITDLAADVLALLTRELDGLKRELGLFPDDDSLWRTVPGITNPAGNLALHVAGGLQHFIGAVLGGTGYVRDRDAEFSRRTGARSQVIAELDRALAIVRTVLPQLSEASLAAELPEPVLGARIPTSRFLLHLCAHAAFHLGQAGYLRRALTGDSTSSGPLPVSALGI